jgi:hypothetical protein
MGFGEMEEAPILSAARSVRERAYFALLARFFAGCFDSALGSSAGGL